MNFLNDLLTAYTEIVKAEPDTAVAAGHLLNFLDDVRKISTNVQEAIVAAKARANQPPVA